MANKPSIKTLETIFGDKAKEARRVLEGNRAMVMQYEGARRRAEEAWRITVPLDELKMYALNTLGQFHGVESVKLDRHYADFLNAGDVYTPTLIYWDGRFRVQTYGDFLEIQERRMKKSY